MSRKISFVGESFRFDEWIEPGGVEANRVVASKRPESPSDRRIFYQSFGSGSSGNSCYLGTPNSGILIDAGVRDDAVQMMLRSNGISMDRVKGILLTHDHNDHVRYAYRILRNNKHIRLLCTHRVLNGLLRHHNVSNRIKDYHVPIFKEIPFKVGDFEVTAFDVPHDGSDNMGFSIAYGSRNFVLATDMGEVTERARHYMSEANYLVVEANYDRYMLDTGRYPEHLKARIVTSHGHMDNTATAQILTEILHPGLSHIFLCHLSKENNTPEKARGVISAALQSIGRKVGEGEDTLSDRDADVQLVVLPRLEPTRLYVFR